MGWRYIQILIGLDIDKFEDSAGAINNAECNFGKTRISVVVAIT
jgi:hypothetical protein